MSRLTNAAWCFWLHVLTGREVSCKAGAPLEGGLFVRLTFYAAIAVIVAGDGGGNGVSCSGGVVIVTVVVAAAPAD